MENGRENGTSVADQAAGVQGETADAFSIGELINERYSVLVRVSQGPSGKLYRARDVRTESEVTLKLLLGWPTLDEAVVRQLREELSLTRALIGRPSGIALVYGCELTTDGRAFVVMEGLAGRNLAELIRWREPLSVERALRLALQIAKGLHAAHSVRLIHGALSAEHVLVQNNDTVKVMGFEVARLEAANRVSSRPPSNRAEVLSEAADTRAAAMVLLEMLTSGVRPGPQGAAADPEAPRGGEIPAAIKQFVMQALVTSPGPPSLDMTGLTRALSAELNRRQERPNSRALNSRALRRARPRPPRRRLTLIAAGVLALLVSASAGWVAWSRGSAPRPPVTRARALPPQPVSSDPAASVPGGAPVPPSGDSTVESPAMPVTQANPLPPERPRSTALASPGDGVAPQARVKRPPTESSVANQAVPAAGESAPARPREVAKPEPRRGSVSSESEAPDPSAIIDWLIKAKERPSEPR